MQGEIDVPALALVDPLNTAEQKIAIEKLGGISLILNLPIAAQTQDVLQVPPAGIWSPEGLPGGWPPHWAPSSRCDSNGIWLITWGGELLATWGFILAYAVAIVTAASRIWLEASGETPSLLHYDELLAAQSSFAMAA